MINQKLIILKCLFKISMTCFMCERNIIKVEYKKNIATRCKLALCHKYLKNLTKVSINKSLIVFQQISAQMFIIWLSVFAFSKGSLATVYLSHMAIVISLCLVCPIEQHVLDIKSGKQLY